MLNTITARRISYNLIALIVVLVAIALLGGFAAGAMSNPSGANTSIAPAAQAQINSPVGEKPNAPTSGWVKQFDAPTGKWFVHHLVMTPSGLAIDRTIELQCDPDAAIQDGCGLYK